VWHRDSGALMTTLSGHSATINSVCMYMIMYMTTLSGHSSAMNSVSAAINSVQSVSVSSIRAYRPCAACVCVSCMRPFPVPLP
jgi:hypothetical protein